MNKKVKRYLPIFISLLVVIASIVVLMQFVSFYNSKKINLIHTFDESVSYTDGMLLGKDKTYFFNPYGGDVIESDIMSIPLSQYGGPDVDFTFSQNNGCYFAVDGSKAFNGANETYMFLCEHNNVLYLVNTYDNSCIEIQPNTNFHSASTNGTFLVEICDGLIFYEKLDENYKLSKPVEVKFDTESVDICFWLNDYYLLVKNENEYTIVNAVDGDTLPCFTIKSESESLISERFIFESYDNKAVSLFDLYSQKQVKLPFKSTVDVEVLAVSGNAEYAVLKSDNVFVISDSEKLNLSQKLNADISEAVFIRDNILLVSYVKNGKAISEIYKIML